MFSFIISGQILSIPDALPDFVSFIALLTIERVVRCSFIHISSYVSSFSCSSVSSLVLCGFLSLSLFKIPEKYSTHLFSSVPVLQEVHLCHL
jgi:hypothetical protein